jgi:hypothetical protein
VGAGVQLFDTVETYVETYVSLVRTCTCVCVSEEPVCAPRPRDRVSPQSCYVIAGVSATVLRDCGIVSVFSVSFRVSFRDDASPPFIDPLPPHGSRPVWPPSRFSPSNPRCGTLDGSSAHWQCSCLRSCLCQYDTFSLHHPFPAVV